MSNPIEPLPPRHERSAAPTTTAEQDRRTDSQRQVNIIWERTQQIIALSVVEVTLLVAASSVVSALFNTSVDHQAAVVAFLFLVSVSNLVIGFYFGRTNHARIGDDPKPSSTGGGLDDR